MSHTILLLGHAAVTWALVGLIWTVQRVQYPGFAHVPATAYRAFHEHHMRAITGVVAPLMCVELALAGWIAWAPPTGVSPVAAWVGLGLVVLLWLSTAFVQVPLHARLARVPSGGTLRLLVRSNWLRTLAWSARGVLAAAWLAAAPPS